MDRNKRRNKMVFFFYKISSPYGVGPINLRGPGRLPLPPTSRKHVENTFINAYESRTRSVFVGPVTTTERGTLFCTSYVRMWINYNVSFDVSRKAFVDGPLCGPVVYANRRLVVINPSFARFAGKALRWPVRRWQCRN